MSNGFLALVLHAHLPYVRHPEYDEFLEEDWLFEAITETYLPHAPGPLAAGGRKRPLPAHHLAHARPSARCSAIRSSRIATSATSSAPSSSHAANSSAPGTIPASTNWRGCTSSRFITCRNLFVDGWRRDIVTPFAQLQEHGVLEIITCAATHGFLPLMANFPEAVRAQILIARDHYRETFGRDPVGIWLPECGYVPGLENVLQEANIRWFIMDAHGFMFGSPRPRYAIYAPVFTPSGVAAFARDRDSSRQVWSAEEGYPGDPAYRDFYRDIGMDLPIEYIRPFLPPDGGRKFTGIKYHRITGRTKEKEIYHRAWAMAAADAHAGNFVWNRRAANPASARKLRHGPHRRQPLRRGTLRPLVVRGPGVPQPLHPQIRLRPAGLSRSPRPAATWWITRPSRCSSPAPRAGATKATGKSGSTRATPGSTPTSTRPPGA